MQESEEKSVVQEMVRCCDCVFEREIKVKNILGDGICERSDRTLVGYANNRKALRQPRKCWTFKPKVQENGHNRG